MIQLSEQFVPIKLDGEKEGLAAFKKYGLRGFPSILFVDGDGKVVYQTAGYQPPEGFAAMMNRVLDLKHVPEWETSLKAHPNDMQLLSKLGMAAAMKNQDAAATDYATRAEAAFKAGHSAEDTAAYADLMNGVGDMLQSANKLDPAIGYFEKAAGSGAETGKVAYALISEAYCYLSMEKPMAKEALDVVNRGEALPGLAKSDADTFASLKKACTQMLNGKGG